MSDKDPKDWKPEDYEESHEHGRPTVVPVPSGQRAPDQLCIINLEVQFYDDEDDSSREERKSFIRELAEEIHNRLMKLGRGWQRHSCSYRSLEIEGDLSLVAEAAQNADEVAAAVAKGEPIDPAIAGKLTILH